MIRRVLLAVLLMASVMATPAQASVEMQNFMTADITPAGQGLGVYQYQTGVQAAADFATGVHTGTVENAGTLELAPPPAGWFDLAWNRRQCFDITAAAAVAEYPLRLEVDTSGSASTGADIRVFVGTNGAQLTSFSEGPFTSTASVVWAKVAPLPAGVSTYCVYFDNAVAPTVSDESAVFTPTTAQTVSYYTMLNTYNNTNLQVVSYTANNTVSDGTTTVVLGVGGTHTFTGTNRHTVITATGPIEGSADINGTETILPESFAHDEFVFGVNRGVNGAWVRSPFGTTTIQAIVNGGVVNSVINLTPAMGSVWLQGDFASDDTLILRSTDGTDFLAMFKSTNNNDVGPAVHNYGDPIYGVRSRTILTGAIGTANITLLGSDGTNINATASDTVRHSNNNNTDGRGNGTAFEITSDGAPISSYQFADQNGSEVTAFYPTRRLSETWITPIPSRYITVACPTNPTTVTIGGTNFACTGAAGAPGFAYGGLVNRPAGTVITADNPIYVYYESGSRADEHNLIGMRGGLPYVPNGGPAIAPRAVEMLPATCGSWESDPVAVAGVFGQVDITPTIPAGTSANFQISTGGLPFYGPDGTPATSFANADIVPYVADFAADIRFRVELCRNGLSVPSVSNFSAHSDLIELVGDHTVTSGVSLVSSPTVVTEPVLRVYQGHAGTWQGSVEYVGGVNLGPLATNINTDHPSAQVSVSGGSATQHTNPFSHTTPEPYSVLIEHSITAGQTSEVLVDLVDVGLVKLENRMRFTFVG